MRAASRESLASARERLSALTGTAAQTQRLAADLRSVAALLVREPSLRRAWTDPARGSDVRTGLLDQLLGSRLGEPALDVLRVAVGSRWSHGTDLVDAVELLSVDAELAVAEKAGELGDVEDELFRFGRLVHGDARLAGLLADVTVPAERRVTLATTLLEGKAKASTVRLVELAVSGFGGRAFEAALDRLVELAAARQERRVAYVRVASALTAQQESRLAAYLSRVYGQKVSVKTQLDPSVIGGLTIRVGDDLYDGSVARRLEQARAVLAH